MREGQRRYRKTPRGQFNVHKVNAKGRRIAFELTFDQWWRIWKASNKWNRRGNRPGQFVMCRFEDEGGYTEGNVFIGSFHCNLIDRNRSVAIKRRHTKKTTTVIFNDIPF